ncbi:MAG: response regulator [Candidatus Rokubacteria bacterium]|nr:response regulator [Candidatus Rokubacteria bacterium]
MTQERPRIFLVDDDPGVLKALTRLLRAAGHTVETYATPGELLRREHYGGPGCVVLDLRMPEMTGMELQEALERAGSTLPVVFVTGHGDIPTGVKAMKEGAVDFLTKPVDEKDLLAAVDRALEREAGARVDRAEREAARARYARLTAREREVCALVATGALNKQIAAELGASEKTIKVHRARVMEKLGVGSVAELVRLFDRVRAGSSGEPVAPRRPPVSEPPLHRRASP